MRSVETPRPARAASLRANAANAPAATAPLLLRAARGEAVERPPVWMMRQAGRYMKVYQELCKKHTTFRERSENVDLAVEISLQPWHAFRPDGVILFSDILTPLTGMNIPFDIVAGKGPVIENPIRTMEDVKKVRTLVPEEAVPYTGAALTTLRAEVGDQAAVLGFVGAPFTLASYIVEGGSSKNYTKIKKMAFTEPEVLHALLDKLAESIIIYTRYQADAGAQAVQLFDSWASFLTPDDFEVFSLPYLKKIIEEVKKTHPDLPIILYASGSGGLLERMALAKPDIMSIDASVDLLDAKKRLPETLGLQGNMDPAALFGSKEHIEKEVIKMAKKGAGRAHIMNLGHGVLVGTPEENVAHYFEVAKTVNERI